MKISLSWLREFVQTKKKAKEIGDILINLGIETEVKNADILEIEVNPNRGDLLSILGVSRELAAKLNKTLKMPQIEIKEKNINLELDFKISEQAKKFVPRFAYRIIKGVKIGPSPKEITDKLETYGFRSLNNVVDITNLVMIELGQPLHAFDYQKLGGRLFLRLSEKGEKVLTLDGKGRNLPKNALIAENKKGKIVDLAGIMGGFYSEIDEKSEVIVLQAAIFEPVSIRKTSKFLHHTTDASYRYERGVDFAMVEKALDRASNLIIQTAGGEMSQMKDLIFEPVENREIQLNADKVNYLLGTNFSKDEIKESLIKFGFGVKEKKENFEVSVPSYRMFDILFWQDLAEEVLRFQGYSILKPENLKKEKGLKKNIKFRFKERLKDFLISLGFSETLSYSFISQEDLALFGLNKKNLLKIANPLSSEFAFFRPNLLINILKQVAKNPYFSEINLFEIGNIYFQKKEKEKIIILSTEKEKLEKIIRERQTINFNFKINQVPEKITNQLKIKKRIYYLEENLQYPEKGDFEFKDLKIRSCRIPSDFPPAQIDLAFIVNQNINSQKIKETILNHPKVILTELFDEFVSEKFGPHKKNLAYHLWIEDPKKALSESEIAAITKEIVANVVKTFRAKLRTF